jgi:hypothetical protein
MRDNFKNNIKALDSLRVINKKINRTGKYIKLKYLLNKKKSFDNNKLLDDSMEKFYKIIKNLDKLNRE